ncbi:hypothetical protein JTE90_012584 [Oedothorax gibbosus]|uniref:Uncharacterized protein n=1 Tax=Oedothorax gibbosus TaxID=931172 RepID=A0AAV6V3A4_9ARAC|nr:hypothetical protein JTE90_012584 [Oedothorax gibbosus]
MWNKLLPSISQIQVPPLNYRPGLLDHPAPVCCDTVSSLNKRISHAKLLTLVVQGGTSFYHPFHRYKFRHWTTDLVS